MKVYLLEWDNGESYSDHGTNIIGAYSSLALAQYAAQLDHEMRRSQLLHRLSPDELKTWNPEPWEFFSSSKELTFPLEWQHSAEVEYGWDSSFYIIKQLNLNPLVPQHSYTAHRKDN